MIHGVDDQLCGVWVGGHGPLQLGEMAKVINTCWATILVQQWARLWGRRDTCAGLCPIGAQPLSGKAELCDRTARRLV